MFLPAEVATKRTIATIAAAASYWAWLVMFFTSASAHTLPADTAAGTGVVAVVLPSILARFAGTCLGAGAMIALGLRCKDMSLDGPIFSRTSLMACTGALGALCVLYHVAPLVAGLPQITVAIQLLAFAVGIVPSLYFLLSLFNAGAEVFWAGTLLGLVSSSLLCDVAYATIARNAPPVAAASFHALFLVVATILLFKVVAPAGATDAATRHDPKAEQPRANRPVRPPSPLVRHLVLFPAGTSLLSALVTSGVTSPSMFGASTAIGGLCAAGLIVLTKKNLFDTQELWYRVRGIVFPLTIVLYMLIPLLGNHDLLTVLKSCLSGYYNFLILVGCFLMAQETIARPALVFSWFYLTSNIGCLAGWVIALGIEALAIAYHPTHAQVVTLIAFVLLSLGIFWIGRDNDLRKWWGLRRNFTAQQYRNATLEAKCQSIAGQYHLSRREHEVLGLLARSKRPHQIAEELYISERTARNHIQNIYKKLDVHSAAALEEFIEHARA